MALTQIPSGMIAPAQTLSLNGVTFPATQVPSANANTLDDYEEGTWTPTVGGTATYGASNGGTYTKIGNMVYCNFSLQVSTIGTGSKTGITGLPFAAKASNISAGQCFMQYWANLTPTVYYVGGYINQGLAQVTFVSTTGSQSTVNNGNNTLQDGSRIDGTLVYSTD